MMTDGKSDKKPIFKKAWFWAIVAIVVIGAGIAISSSNNQPTKVGDGGGSGQITDNANKDFETGDIIKVDNQEVSVKSVDTSYTSSNEYIKASDGKKYVKVNVEIKNTSNDKIDYNTLYWKIEDESGDINDYMSAAMAQADDNLGSGELAAGGTKKGSIVFEVPASSTKLKIHYKPNLFSSNEVIVNL